VRAIADALHLRLFPGIVSAMSTAALLAFTLAASAIGQRWMDLTAAQREAQIAASADKALAERVLEASQRFVGTPYQVSPLGEGTGRDADPRIRFDAVDCQTFVEETIALSLAGRAAEVESLLTELRYRREPTYEDRNHLMEAQWLPHNVEKGFVRDVTRRYGGEAAIQAVKELTARTWTSRSSLQLALPVDRRPLGTFFLNVIPLPKLSQILPEVPSGTVMIVVREDLPLKATRVSHLGFVIHKGKRTYLRHATSSAGRVVDEELGSFLARNSKYAKWKVVGVSLFEVTSPSASPRARPVEQR